MNGSGAVVHPQDLFVALGAFSIPATVHGKQQVVGQRGGIGVFSVTQVRCSGHGDGTVLMTPTEIANRHCQQIGGMANYQSCDDGDCQDFAFKGPHVQFVALQQGQRKKVGKNGDELVEEAGSSIVFHVEGEVQTICRKSWSAHIQITSPKCARHLFHCCPHALR